MTPRPPPAHQTGKISYLEIPARDVHESAAFYETAFDWNIRSRETDRPSFDDTTAQVSGAFVRNGTPDADPGMLTYIMVASAAAATDRVVAAGGSIVLPVGRYETEVLATFLDPAGNLLGIYQQPGLADAETGA